MSGRLGRLALMGLLALAACDGDGSSGGASSPAPPAGTPPEDLPRVYQYARAAVPALVMEVDAVPGFEPRGAVADSVAARFEALLDKPDGVSVVVDGVLESRGADHAWTFEEVDALSAETFDLPVGDGVVKLHVLLVDGHWHEDGAGGKVLGIAWANTHVVLFKATIEGSCRSGPGVLPGAIGESICAAAEEAIWVHEVGHVIGLVDNGLPMQADHRDPQHGAHDASDDCVMYWAYEGTQVIDLIRDRLIGGKTAPLDFDAACRADIEAAKGG